VGHTPKVDYLGDKKVLTAQGSGSQTTPTFALNGGVLTYSASGEGDAYFYVVPVGHSLDVSQPPSWQVPEAGSGNVVATVPSVGKYRLYILAAAGSHWSVTLREFWLTPHGVTKASSSVDPVAGRTLVEVRGQGNYRSPTFTLPEGDSYISGDGGYYAVIGAVAASQGSSMDLVQVGGPAIPVNNLSSSPGVEGSFVLPGPGQYYLQVISSGTWMFALQYGTDQFIW
jgi:hypothetical protein